VEKRGGHKFLKITVLIENSVARTMDIVGEHGLGLWVETPGHRFLYDTGQTGALVRNAQVLGVPLKEADAVVLSHGHYDHTGGLREVLKAIGRPVPVYAHPDLFSPHRVSDPERYVGVPFARAEIEACGADFRWVDRATEIFPRVWAGGAVPRTNAFERGDPRMYVVEQGQRVPDPLADDLSLYLSTDTGLVILTGCAHAGLMNIVEHARTVTGQERVRAVIGGTHLGPAAPEQREETVRFLKDLGLELLAAGHCTGQAVAARLSAEFGPRFSFGGTGLTYEF